MSNSPDNELFEVMDFIIDSVAQETDNIGRAEIGIYLLSLVLAEYQRVEGEEEACGLESRSHDEV